MNETNLHLPMDKESLVHEVRLAHNPGSPLSLVYSSVLQSSLQSRQCPLLALFSCTSCPSCFHFISVSCHVFLATCPFAALQLFVNSTCFSAFLHTFFCSAFMICICICLPHHHFSSVHNILLHPMKFSGLSRPQVKSQCF